jgi:hypothetical protein
MFVRLLNEWIESYFWGDLKVVELASMDLKAACIWHFCFYKIYLENAIEYW